MINKFLECRLIGNTKEIKAISDYLKGHGVISKIYYSRDNTNNSRLYLNIEVQAFKKVLSLLDNVLKA